MGFSAWQTSPVVLQCFVTGHLAHSCPSVGFRLRTWQQGSAYLSIIALDHCLDPMGPRNSYLDHSQSVDHTLDDTVENWEGYWKDSWLWTTLEEHRWAYHTHPCGCKKKTSVKVFNADTSHWLNTSHSFTAPTSQSKHNQGCKEKETKLTIRSESATALTRSGGSRKEDAKRESHPRADLRSSRL